MLCESVSGLGLQAEEASDGLEALERFREGRFDMVITDLSMPRMDGIELTHRLKSLDPGVAVLVITGQSSLDLMARAMNQGIVDYLRKPFRFSVLEKTVRRALAHRGSGLPHEAPSAPPVSRVDSSRMKVILVWVSVLLALLCMWRLWVQEGELQALANRIDGMQTEGS